MLFRSFTKSFNDSIDSRNLRGSSEGHLSKTSHKYYTLSDNKKFPAICLDFKLHRT